jgi:hypothetical protein
MNSQKSSNGASLGEEKACLICPERINHPEMGLERLIELSTEWSSREILAHLVDDEIYVMRTRLERIIKEDHPSLAPHDEKQWYANRNTTRDAPVELLGDFAVQRAASLGIIKMLRESDWMRQGYQPEYGLFTAQEWLSQWVAHDTAHLRQVESNTEEYQAQTFA